MLATKTIPEQLTDIYIEQENWHSFKMPYAEALKYHQERLDNGVITVYVEDGEVLGYYSRVFDNNTCYFLNAYIKPEYRFSKVYRYLKRKFFQDMPERITRIVGNKQKLNGKFDVAFLKWSNKLMEVKADV